MPITVAHQPSAYGIGAIAFDAGLGQYRQQQQENAMRQAALYLQGAQQQQGYQLAQQRNALDWAQLQSQNQRFDAGLMQNAWQSQNELAAQDQWRKDQLAQQQNLWDAQRQREQLEWDERRQMHAEDMTARGELAAANREFQKSEFDRQQEVELNAVGQKIKAKYDTTRAIIEREVKDPELKQKFLDAFTAEMAGIKFSDFQKPQEPTVDDSINKTRFINGVPVQHIVRDGQKQLAAVQGVPTKLDVDQHALKIADHQLKAYETWINTNNARRAAALENPVEMAKYEAERQSMFPQPLDAIKAKLMKELQAGEGEGEQTPQQGGQQQGQSQGQPVDQQKQAQAAQLELAAEQMPPMVAAAANRLKAAALSGQTQITPEMQQDADLVRGWKLRNQQNQPLPTAPPQAGYSMPPPDVVAPPAPPVAPPVRVSNPSARHSWMQPEFAASGF